MGYRPGTKFYHPGRTSLDDFKFHGVLILVAVGSSDNVLGSQIGPFNVSEGNLLVTVG